MHVASLLLQPNALFYLLARAAVLTRLTSQPAAAWILMGATLAGQARAAEPAYDPIVFRALDDAGVRFVVEPNRTRRRHQPETMISGIALFDYDADGRLDI